MSRRSNPLDVFWMIVLVFIILAQMTPKTLSDSKIEWDWSVITVYGIIIAVIIGLIIHFGLGV